MELDNCPNCDAIFVKSAFRDVCEACAREEDADFEEVYQYIRKRANRTASMKQVIEATGVAEERIVKFVKNGRLRLSQFPNLGVPCEKCGAPVKDGGRLCTLCAKELRTDLAQFELEEQQQRDIEARNKATYYMKGN